MNEETKSAGTSGAPGKAVVVSDGGLDGVLRAAAQACARSLCLVADLRRSEIDAILRRELRAFRKATDVATDEPILRNYAEKMTAEIQRIVAKHVQGGVDVDTCRKKAHDPARVTRNRVSSDLERNRVDVRDESRDGRALPPVASAQDRRTLSLKKPLPEE